MSKIIAVVGMPGSGASTITKYISEKGYPRIHFGGIIYQAMTEAGVEVTPENQAKFRIEIRQKEGADFIVNKVIGQTNTLIRSGQKNIIYDGLYSWLEYKVLKQEFPGELSIIGVVAPRNLRHRRLAGRPEHPFTVKQATERDWSEIENINKGGPIAMADSYIISTGNFDSLYQQVEKSLAELNFYN